MAAESGMPEESRWLLSPPGPGEVKLQIETGEGIGASLEVRAALEQLMKALAGAEVEGYIGNITACFVDGWECSANGPCITETMKTCAADYHCQIGPNKPGEITPTR
jgi:hypothetical protein